MGWVRGTGPMLAALSTAVVGVLLLAFSSTLNPLDALLGRAAVVAVPDLTGQAQPRAVTEAEDLGLVVTTSTAFSLTVPRGSVVGQDPRPGERVRQGSTLELVVSQGVRRVEMPDAVGRQLDEVRGDLDDADIPIELERTVSESIPAGEVIDQDPGPGVQITAETDVRFEVSAGPADRPVPDVVGLSVDAASFTLGAAGLTPAELELRDDPDVPQGAVISTDPPSGEVVPIDTDVAVVVSAGPAQVEVPQLVDETQREATAALEALGFSVVIAGRLVGPDDNGLGSVFGQHPEAGAFARPGTAVTIVVGRRPPDPPPPNTTTTTTTTTTTIAEGDEDDD